MSIIKYRAFIKVVEQNSITKAAKELCYSQPAISRMIDSLEDDIGFALLNRNKDSITITENGKAILKYCYQIVEGEDALQAAANSIKGLLKGDIKIGAFNSMLIRIIPYIISEFVKIHPNINIHLQEVAFGSSWKKLQNGSIDAAFMNDDIPNGFEFYPLVKDLLGVVMSINHPFASQSKISVDNLAECDFIMPQPGWDAMFHLIAKQKNFTPNIKYHVASDNAGITMAANATGVFIISKMHTDNLPNTVVFLLFEEKFYRTLGICVKSFKEAPPALKALIQFIKIHIPQNYFDTFI